MLAIGVVVAYAIAEKRWERMGHDPKQMGQIAVPVVIGGVVGARVYHLFTGYDWDQGGLADTVKIWKGGLSIWGVLAGGFIAVVLAARHYRVNILELADAIAPGVALAQAIGRWGNYFNQELFGRPTDLPWALEIDPANRPIAYAQNETFHPTFLYESLWCLAVFGILLWAERRYPLKRGQVTTLYLALYTFGRIWFEMLRIDEASKVFGIRFNLLLTIATCVFSIVMFVWLGRRRQPEPAADAAPIVAAENLDRSE
jgi:prolipoprotein diacylglyceryl transferase